MSDAMMTSPLHAVIAAVRAARREDGAWLDPLTGEIVGQALAALKRPPLMLWVERWFVAAFDDAAGMNARRLGVSPARGLIERERHRWEPWWLPSETGESLPGRAGEACLQVPVWVRASAGLGGWAVGDVIAWRADDAGDWGSLGGVTDVLGMPAAEGALVDGEPVALQRTPASWCAAGGDAVGVLADGDLDGVARACILDWDSWDARRLLTEAVELVCEDEDHAETVDRALTRLRKSWLPKRPALSVRDGGDSESPPRHEDTKEESAMAA